MGRHMGIIIIKCILPHKIMKSSNQPWTIILFCQKYTDSYLFQGNLLCFHYMFIPGECRMEKNNYYSSPLFLLPAVL
jgi:hypothetical protein